MMNYLAVRWSVRPLLPESAPDDPALQTGDEAQQW